MTEPKTFREAEEKAFRLVWPGCDDGRKRPCGRIHDLGLLDLGTGTAE